jgi:hypothetical protein
MDGYNDCSGHRGSEKLNQNCNRIAGASGGPFRVWTKPNAAVTRRRQHEVKQPWRNGLDRSFAPIEGGNLQRPNKASRSRSELRRSRARPAKSAITRDACLLAGWLGLFAMRSIRQFEPALGHFQQSGLRTPILDSLREFEALRGLSPELVRTRRHLPLPRSERSAGSVVWFGL